MPEREYYEILGVGEKASPDAIKKAYRRLARENHPDRNPDRPDAEERFKEIQEAYHVLSDPTRRRRYDRFRKDPFGGFSTGNGSRYYRAPDGSFVRTERPGRPPDPDFYGGDEGTLGGLGSFFSRLFGGDEPAPPPRTRPGQKGNLDIETRLRLTFRQALDGGRTEVTLPHGETVRFSIPRGVRPGFKIRLKGRGGVGVGSIRGDLYVTFEIDPHPQFQREGDDLHTTNTVSAIEAMLGTTRIVRTAYGKDIKLTIPPGTQPGARLRLKGQGVITDKGVGDLYVRIDVHIPDQLTQEQRDILRLAAQRAKLF